MMLFFMHLDQIKNSTKPYVEYYTPELVDIIYNKFKVDIEHFGYTFGN